MALTNFSFCEGILTSSLLTLRGGVNQCRPVFNLTLTFKTKLVKQHLLYKISYSQ